MAFSYYRTLTIDHTKCGSANSSSFPVLVSISDITFKDAAHSGHIQNSSGYDIIFTSDSAGTTKIPWEIESYDNVNGVLVAWVNIATVSHIADTVFYVFFGDATISTAQNTGSFAPAAVWDANYKIVLHLGDGTALNVNDSTTNGVNPSSYTGITAVTGKIGGGANFDGSHVIDFASQSALNNWTTQTISFWAKPNVGMNLYARLAEKGANTEWAIIFFGTSLCWQASNNSSILYSIATVADGNWHKIDIAVASDYSVKLYVDGSLNASEGPQVTPSDKVQTLRIGNYGGGGSYFYNGILDEFSISDGSNPRSTDWILTSYNNQNAPGNIGTPGFLTFGSETSSSTTITENLSDTLSLSDGILSDDPILSISVSVSDTLSLTFSLSDTLSIGIPSVSNSLTFSDNLSLYDAIFLSSSAAESVSDIISLSDTSNVLNPLNLSPSDSLSLSDVIGSLNTYSNHLSDTLSLLDSVSISQPLPILLSDTLIVSDTLSISLAAALAVSDTLQLSDFHIVFRPVSSALAETLIFSDSLSQLLTYATTFSDVIALSDATIVRAIIPSRIPIWHLQQSMSGVLSGH